MPSISCTCKSLLICFVSTFTLLSTNSAFAQEYGGTIGSGAGGVTGSALAASDFTVLLKGYSNGQWVQMNSTTAQYYFNRARCLCDTDPNGEFEVVLQPGPGVSQKIMAQLQNDLTGGQGASYLFAGTQGVDCLNPSAYVGSLGPFCTNLVAPGSGYPGTLLSTMAAFENVNFVVSPPIPVAYLFNSLTSPLSCGANGTCDSAATCSTTSVQANLQLWVQTNTGTMPDLDPGPTATVNLVGNVPVTPADVTAEGGNEALKVGWDWGGVDIATNTTIRGVQVFCQRGADTQVFANGLFSPAYQTPATLCPNSPAATRTSGGPFSDFDPRYLCSGLIPATSTSYRISGLQNGIAYGVGVAAVDKYGNIGAIANVAYGMPNAGVGGTGGTSGAGGSVGGPDADATGGALGSGGEAGGSQAAGATGADGGIGVRLGSGCSCDIRGKSDRSESAGMLGLAFVALALALRSRRSRPRSVLWR
jgi:hypothetical protein